MLILCAVGILINDNSIYCTYILVFVRLNCLLECMCMFLLYIVDVLGLEENEVKLVAYSYS